MQYPKNTSTRDRPQMTQMPQMPQMAQMTRTDP
jgi:hypothetical protein